MTGCEEQLLTRAEVLEDTGDLVQSVLAVLAGAQGAGVDLAAIAGLAAAARALDPGASTGYEAGSEQDRHPGGGYRSDAEFLEAAAEAEGDTAERLREVENLQEQLAAAMDAAQAALKAAHAMPVKDKCDGCHAARAAAIADAERRIRLCEATAEILDPLARRLQGALSRLRQVPQDLGEAYTLIYEFVRSGGKLPRYGRWIEGANA
jgi:hypothetical protein